MGSPENLIRGEAVLSEGGGSGQERGWGGGSALACAVGRAVSLQCGPLAEGSLTSPGGHLPAGQTG